MRALALFVLLALSAVANLLLNFYAPTGLKLLIVPVFGLVFVALVGMTLRRPG